MTSGSSAGMAGMSYGDLLAPPPSYADSMMFSSGPPGPGAFHQPPLTGTTVGGSHADGMMNTVALEAPGAVGRSAVAVGAAGFFSSSASPNAADSPATSSHRSPSSSSSSFSLDVVVSDPQISSSASGGAFGKRVVTYKVRARTDNPSFVVRDCVTWRRFRDFVALADRLAASHRGHFVPPRPEKSFTASSSDDAFVRARAAALELYLKNLAAHPATRRSAELRVFLTSHDLERDPQWAAFKTTHHSVRDVVKQPNSAGGEEAVGGALANENGAGPTIGGAPSFASAQHPTSGGGGMVPGSVAPGGGAGSGISKFFATLRHSVASSGAAHAASNALGGLGGLGAARVSEDDQAFVAERDRVARLEQELAVASQKAEKVLLQEEKYGDAMGELGLECMKLGKLEEEEAGRLGNYTEHGANQRAMAQRAKKMGNAAVRVSRLARAATRQLAKSLEPLHEYLGMMPAVRKAVQDRGETLGALNASLAEVESKRARIAKLELDITKMLRVDALKRELVGARAAADAAASEYEEMKTIQRDEFARLERTRAGAFEDMWLGFARTQAAHAERALSVWRALAEDLGASPDEWLTNAAVPDDERRDQGADRGAGTDAKTDAASPGSA